MVALIPARAGSKRIPGKNMKKLAGHPLIAYTIAAAQQSGVFGEHVYVVARDVPTRELALDTNVRVLNRSDVSEADGAPDIVWVRGAFEELARMPSHPDAFAILRPTSPFRTAATIRRAYDSLFRRYSRRIDSLRAVELVKQSPYKMWASWALGFSVAGVNVSEFGPVLSGTHQDGTPYHSSPTQSLPTIYAQNSSLEMAWTRCVEQYGTISGQKVAPFFTEEYEGFSIDYPADWREAEYLIASGEAVLPEVSYAVHE